MSDELEKTDQDLETVDNKDTQSDMKDDIIEGIKEDLETIEKEDTSTEDKKEVKVETRDFETSPIPSDFSSAAKDAGFSDEDIKSFATNYTDDELKAMIEYLSDEDETEDKTEEKDEVVDGTKKTDEPEKSEITEKEQLLIDKAKEAFLKEYGTEIEEVKAFKQAQQEKQDSENLKTINKKFDEFSEKIAVFGKTDELPRFPAGKFKGQVIPSSPEVKARNEVFGYAKSFIRDGRPIDEAMDYALMLYKGKNLETETQRSVIKDLKKHEEMLSGSRVGKEIKRTYTDNREEMIDEIRQMQRSIGQDV